MPEKPIALTADEVVALQLHEALDKSTESDYNRDYKIKIEKSPEFQKANIKVQNK